MASWPSAGRELAVEVWMGLVGILFSSRIVGVHRSFAKSGPAEDLNLHKGRCPCRLVLCGWSTYAIGVPQCGRLDSAAPVSDYAKKLQGIGEDPDMSFDGERTLHLMTTRGND